METPEAVERLLRAVERLSDRIASLDARLQRLEEGAPAPPREVGPGEEREGSFGPAVKRSDPSRHAHAVNRALAMLGVVPEARPAKAHTARHRHAVEQVRRMSGKPAEPEEIVPLPEILERPPVERASPAAPPVDLEGALDVDLAHEARDSRVSAIYLLFPQVILVAGVMALLPGPMGVLASLPIIAFLAAPLWGSHTRTLQAHARFFTIMILARSLAPDVAFLSLEPRWWNPRVLAMALASLPGLVLVYRGSLGWGMVAFLLSMVIGAAVGVESGSLDRGLLAACVALIVCLFLRRAKPADSAS